MADLKIGEIILRERRKLNMTQEELANALTVTAQAVSNWERGGYPDITLLVRIANFFKITVDELVGNDQATMDDDMVAFGNKYRSNQYSKAEKLAFAKEMYEKYPNNFELINALGECVVNNMESISENMALLKEIHQKIMTQCTDEEYRRASIHRMCFVATDDELEDLIGKSELNWQEAIAIGELREERYILQGRFDEFRRERSATDLLIFMQYLGRYNMNYYGKREHPAYVQNFAEPARTAAWEKHKMRLLEGFDEDGIVPEAWCGCYAEFSLKAAGALIACGNTQKGFAMLENTFALYERWNRIPKGKCMEVGNNAIFGKATVQHTTEYITDICFEDGHKVWAPYIWLFWQTPKDIYVAMTQWPWFNGVREDERYLTLLARAKEMAKTI
ncbi:MAG: helix-turn-helix transcriptional regulator [Ruminococcaceae bacterium]|nr:helix-turn-helix transcriptional regulator [Oscillospiraceae bacterium]